MRYTFRFCRCLFAVSVAACVLSTPLLKATEQTEKLNASDAANADRFGSSVSIDGGTVLVGAPQHEDTADAGDDYGAAYVFEVDPFDPTIWNEVTKLQPSAPVLDARFGTAVSLSGSTALVGAPRENGSVGGGQGAAYVFERDSGGTWAEADKLTPTGIEQGDNFGIAVSLDGDRAIVGAYHDDDAGPTSGSAHIFERNEAGEWDEITKLVGDDTATMDEFGFAVAIQGDNAFVSAPYHDHGGSNTGAVYVFERLPDGNWLQIAELRSFEPETGAYFGYSISIDGTTALIGAHNDDGAGKQNSGAAFIFARNPDDLPGWIQVAKLLATDAGQGDDLGWAVSLSGSTALVGAPGDDSGDHNAGSAYIFQRDQNGPDQWGEVVELLSNDIDAGDDFGSAVAISSGSAVIGAMADDDNGSLSGSAYVFSVDLPPAPRLSIPLSLPGVVDEPVEVQVSLHTEGTILTGTTFSIDYDASCLDLDPTDGDFDGILDAVRIHAPPQFATSVFLDIADSNGELDVSIIDPFRLSSLADGPLATVTFTPTCVPPFSVTLIAPVDFSSDPQAIFTNDDGQEIPGDAEGGSVEIHGGSRGDCNADGDLDTADLEAIEVEIFDGDGSWWLDVAGGSFVGSSVGCDTNVDTLVNAGDLTCASRLLASSPCQEAAAVAEKPWLSLPYSLAVEDGSVVVDIDFNPADHDIIGSIFALDLDQTRLDFDATDTDTDGVPDSIEILDPAITHPVIRYRPADTEAELQIVIGALSASPTPFGNASVLRIRFPVLTTTNTLEGAIRFADAPPASFGDVEGRAIPGETGFDLRALFADGFESGDLSAWSSESFRKR